MNIIEIMLYKSRIIILLILPMLFWSCDVESDEIFLDETDEDYQLYDYYVDAYGNEGVVANIFNSSNDGSRYILVISSDEAYLSWGPMDMLVYNCDSLDYSTFKTPEFGIAMLQCMKYIGINKFPAQEWCDRKNASDPYVYAGSWHLPSRHELMQIFSFNGSHLSYINKTLYQIGGTLINADDFLWTCLEDFDEYITIEDETSDYDKENRALIMSTHNSTDANKDNWIKKNKHHVRAVKYIYYRNK